MSVPPLGLGARTGRAPVAARRRHGLGVSGAAADRGRRAADGLAGSERTRPASRRPACRQPAERARRSLERPQGVDLPGGRQGRGLAREGRRASGDREGMATRLRKALLGDGASVTWISVKETTAAGLSSTYYADKVSKALGTKPDVVYVSTYFPEGVRIAKALAKAGTNPPCLMGLANADNAFVAKTSLSQAQRCVFSGVPAATEMPSAKAYVGQYRAASARSRASGARSRTTRRGSCSGPSTGRRASTSRRSSARSAGRRASTAPPARSRSTPGPATGRPCRSASSA
jgi:hypothetical protein